MQPLTEEVSHVPCTTLQLLGHTSVSQAEPLNAGLHTHTPLTHVPEPLQLLGHKEMVYVAVKPAMVVVRSDRKNRNSWGCVVTMSGGNVSPV